MAITNETSTISTAKWNFTKATGGSKTVSVPKPSDNQNVADIEGFMDFCESNMTLGGGITAKNYVYDVTQRKTFKRT